MKRISENNNLVRSSKISKAISRVFTWSQALVYVLEIIGAIAIMPTNGAAIPFVLFLFTCSFLLEGGRKIYKILPRPTYEKLLEEIGKETDKDFSDVNLKDLDIVPKNIQVGENLEAINIIPIYKEGHYIIIGSVLDGVVLRQIEEDGQEKIDLLDEEERKDVLIEISTEREIAKKTKKFVKKLYGGNN